MDLFTCVEESARDEGRISTPGEEHDLVDPSAARPTGVVRAQLHSALRYETRDHIVHES